MHYNNPKDIYTVRKSLLTLLYECQVLDYENLAQEQKKKNAIAELTKHQHGHTEKTFDAKQKLNICIFYEVSLNC